MATVYTAANRTKNITLAPAALNSGLVSDHAKAAMKLLDIYDNSGSGLSASTIPTAIDELDADITALSSYAADGVNYSKKVVKASITASELSAGANTVFGAASIPDNAIITDAWIDVVTTVAGDVDDTATIGIGVQTVSAGSEDLINAIAIADSSNPWDAGVKRGLPSISTAASVITNGAEERGILTFVAVGSMTAEEFIVLTAQDGTTYAVAGDVTGSDAEPSDALYTGADFSAQTASLAGLTAAQVAAAFEAALVALEGFNGRFSIDDIAADGTMQLGYVGDGPVTAFQSVLDDGSQTAGSVSYAQGTAGAKESSAITVSQGSPIKLTAAKDITINVVLNNDSELSSGAFVIFVEYVISD